MTPQLRLNESPGPAVADFAPGLSCPTCRSACGWEDAGRRCPGCGRPLALRGGRVVDFLGGDSPTAEEVLAWPDDFVARAGAQLLALRAGEAPCPDSPAELRTAGLVDRRGRLLGLGRKWAYHLEEYHRQAGGDGIPAPVLEKARLGTGSRVLDVGCGAGQTLRLLAPRGPARLVGLDVDLDSLALGCRFAEQDGTPIQFVRGGATALPFRDHSFTHVICRVTLNYVHQGRALGEAARVLAPGGMFYCRAEGPGYDLGLLARAGGARRFLSLLYDLLLGLALDRTGWQPVPGTPWTGGRVFATARRMTKVLDRAGCRVIHAEPGPRYLGFPKRVELLARKER